MRGSDSLEGCGTMLEGCGGFGVKLGKDSVCRAQGPGGQGAASTLSWIPGSATARKGLACQYVCSICFHMTT